MTQAYSNPDRESDPHSLPDVEVFYQSNKSVEYDGTYEPGWYWWPCFPGCLPDFDPVGPFKTQAEALADAQSQND